MTTKLILRFTYIFLLTPLCANDGEDIYKVLIGEAEIHLSFPENFIKPEIKSFIESDLQRISKYMKTIHLEKADVESSEAKPLVEYYKIEFIKQDRFVSPNFLPEVIEKKLNLMYKKQNKSHLVLGSDIVKLYSHKYKQYVEQENLLNDLEKYLAKISEKKFFEKILSNKEEFLNEIYFDENISFENAFSFIYESRKLNMDFDLFSVLHLYKSDKNEKYEHLAYILLIGEGDQSKAGLIPVVYINSKWKIYVQQYP